MQAIAKILGNVASHHRFLTNTVLFMVAILAVTTSKKQKAEYSLYMILGLSRKSYIRKSIYIKMSIAKHLPNVARPQSSRRCLSFLLMNLRSLATKFSLAQSNISIQPGY